LQSNSNVAGTFKFLKEIYYVPPSNIQTSPTFFPKSRILFYN